MAKTPEGRVKHLVKKTLEQRYPKTAPLHVHWPVLTGYGDRELDAYGVANGLAFFVETKAPGKRPTLRQDAKINQWLNTMAPVFVIDGPDSLQELVEWLDIVLEQHNSICA